MASVIGKNIDTFKGQITKDEKLIERMDAILDIIPRIKDAIFRDSRSPLKNKKNIVMNLSKFSITIIQCKMNYFENLKLSRRFKLLTNIRDIVDDVEEKVVSYVYVLTHLGYDFTKLSVKLRN